MLEKEQVPSDWWVIETFLTLHIWAGPQRLGRVWAAERSGEIGRSGQKQSTFREIQAGPSDQKQGMLMEVGEPRKAERGQMPQGLDY